MQQYFKQIIAKLTAQHTEALKLSDSTDALEAPYKDIAANLWTCKCDTEAHLAEWERQNASDLVLVTGPLKATNISIWPSIDSTITFADKDKTTFTIGIPPQEGRTVLETLILLKGKAHEHLSQNTEYNIPKQSQPELNEQPSYSGC